MNEAIRIATRAPRRLLMSLALLVSGAALAHAHLEASTPAANATITQPLTTVTPTFSEPIETLFSVVKAYRLDADVDMSAANAWQRLNGLAGALVNDVLTADDQGAEARVDTGVPGAGATTAEVVLTLKDGLAPGAYVVMWSVLSIDTHTTQGFLVFRYAPAE